MTFLEEYDVCVVGSGAGAGPVIYELAKAGQTVVVLEKGPWFRTQDFTKDELTAVRRSVYTPNLKDEQHVIVETNSDGEQEAESTFDTGRDFWNGNCVGGSSNFMSGYFHRMKPVDFKLLSTYGEIEGANIVDWPISYEDMEPYYAKVEQVVGVSGKVLKHNNLEPRSTADFPYPPLRENIVSEWIDLAAKKLGFQTIPTPRAILSKAKGKRNSCYYSNFCGSYGCGSDAKGSARVALIKDALLTGNCYVVPNAKVYHLETDGNNNIKKAWFYDALGNKQSVQAKIFVVAAQAIETSRLLLMSKNPDFPKGLANNNGQVGKNLIFSGGGTGGGIFRKEDYDEVTWKRILERGVFVNRTLHDFYEINHPKTGKPIKGGVIDFLFEHANALPKSLRQKWDSDGRLIYGSNLKVNLKKYFTEVRKLKFEIFVDWLPTEGTNVSLDPNVKDKWGDPVARVQVDNHPHDVEVGELLAKHCEAIFEEMKLKSVYSSIGGSPPTNLQAGGCRFGNNPQTSVLDKNCKAHEVDNLYVTDGSFMPTGGSVTYTWTIYANSFRVADEIKKRLS